MNIEDKIKMFVEEHIDQCEIEKKYLTIYKDISQINNDIALFCAYIHQLINFYAYNYNDRIGGHFCAGDSRDYIKAIRLIRSFDILTKNSKYELKLENNYKMVLDYAETYLKANGGSEIPNDAPILNLIEYDPIFEINLKHYQNVKYLIFGTDKKPDIIINNVLDADIKVLSNADSCLIYNIPIGNTLTKKDMINWWNSLPSMQGDLFERLCKPLGEIEKKFFQFYWGNSKETSPMLIPQVYLHYDPKTIKELVEIKNGEKRLVFQRMDFLMLVNGNRIIIEIDGVQHYSTGDKPDKKKYANQVKYDRKMKFLNYDIYRIGGYELMDKFFDETVFEFFSSIKKKYYNNLT